MKRKSTLILLVLIGIVAFTAGCNLPAAAPPTPFQFPTPDLTLTAIFSVLVSPTEAPPAVQTATSAPPQPTQAPFTETSTVPPLIQTFVPETVQPTQPPAPTAAPTQIPTQAPTATSANVRSGNTVNAVYLNSEPKIDGSLNEWTMSSYTANHIVFGPNFWDNNADLSARFWAGWDNNYLYLAARVTDEDYVQNARGEEIFLGDSLEVMFDADLVGDFSVTSLNSDDYQLGISPGYTEPGKETEAYLWYPSDRAGSRSGVIIGARRTNDGYDVEVAIPWTLYNVTPQDGRRYGFAFTISDNDRTGKLEQQTMISNVSTRRLSNPTTWGNLYLTR